jgi:hypothetical protein
LNTSDPREVPVPGWRLPGSVANTARLPAPLPYTAQPFPLGLRATHPEAPPSAPGWQAIDSVPPAPRNVDWGFVKGNEGLELNGYVTPDGGGVTVGWGFDIGQHTVADMRAMGMPEYLIERFAPYAAYAPGQMRNGQSARDALAQINPATRKTALQITMEEARIIHGLKSNDTYNTIARIYNAAAAGRSRLQDLPEWAQTIVVDLGFSLGPGFGRPTAAQERQNPALSQAKRDLWSHLTSQDWPAVYRDLTSLNLDRNRRRREAARIPSELRQ